MFDGGFSGAADSFVGSFSLDLNKYAIQTKIFWISRLTKLLNYIEHKKIRTDAVKPIRGMIREMKGYLTNRKSEDINLDLGSESNRHLSDRLDSLSRGLDNDSLRHLHVDSIPAKVRAPHASMQTKQTKRSCEKSARRSISSSSLSCPKRILRRRDF